MTPLAREQLVRAALATAAVLGPALLLAQVTEPVRGVVGLALVGFLPGYALARLLVQRDALQTITLSIALSLALAAALATALLYAGAWSWQACIVVLGGVTLTANLLEWRRAGAPS